MIVVDRPRPTELASLASLLSTALSVPTTEAVLASANELLLVVRDGEELVAGLEARVVLDVVEIDAIVTTPDARRRGHARRLLEKLATLTPGVVRGELEVRASNEAAIALYERHGFVREGRRKAYYRDGEDAVLMGAPWPPSW